MSDYHATQVLQVNWDELEPLHKGQREGLAPLDERDRGQISGLWRRGPVGGKSSAQGAGGGVGWSIPGGGRSRDKGAEVGQCCLVWKQSPHPWK